MRCHNGKSRITTSENEHTDVPRTEQSMAALKQYKNAKHTAVQKMR